MYRGYLAVAQVLIGILSVACAVGSNIATPTQQAPTVNALTPTASPVFPMPGTPTVQVPTPTPTVAIPCQPSVGLAPGYVPARQDEEAGFVAQVRGAEEALREDPSAYQRYCLVASKVTGTFVCKQKLPEDVAARASYEVYSRLGQKQARLSVNCAIEISHEAAFAQDKSPSEQQRLLAATLSHESTHLAQALDMDWNWVVRFDKPWLDNAVKDELARYRASELAKELRALEGLRASQYSRIEREAAEARSQSISRLKAEAESERLDFLSKKPTLDQMARFDQLLAEAVAQAQAKTEDRIATVVAAAKRDADQILAKAMREAETKLAERISEIQHKDRVTDYLKTFEKSTAGKALSPQERNEVIRGECWAQHEERYTSTTIGGTDVKHTLDLILFLNSPQCREYLNLR